MRGPSNGVLLFVVLLSASLFEACTTTKTCPTIACSPVIEINTQGEIAGPYHLTVTVGGMTFTADCPMVKDPPPNWNAPGISFCDPNEFDIVGVNFGESGDDPVDVQARINDGPILRGRALLEGIGNSIDCDIVCSHHRGRLVL